MFRHGCCEAVAISPSRPSPSGLQCHHRAGCAGRAAATGGRVEGPRDIVCSGALRSAPCGIRSASGDRATIGEDGESPVGEVGSVGNRPRWRFPRRARLQEAAYLVHHAATGAWCPAVH